MLVRDMEKALSHAEGAGYSSGSGSLTLRKQPLVHLCRRLDAGSAHRVLVLGGGLSTLFWAALHKLGLLDVTVTTLEHDPALVEKLRIGTVGSSAVDIMPQTLKTIGDDDWHRLFAEPQRAAEVWPSIGTAVPPASYSHYAIRNAFYGEAHQVAQRWPASFDAMIVDGPHGNGRSLAYPLLAPALKPEAWIVVDDFDHYPFLDDLGKLLRYTEHYREVAGDRRWVLLKLERD